MENNGSVDGRALVARALDVPTRTLSPRRGVHGLGVREAAGRVDLLRLFVVRELKLRYTQTLLGPLWVVVTPLAPALLLTAVFTRVVRIDTRSVRYLLLVTTAMAPWSTISRALSRGASSLLGERHLITKVYFPRLLLPAATVIASLVELLVSLAIPIVLAPHTGGRLTLRLVALPALALWTMALALAVCCLVAGFSVRRRDLINALPFLTQLWMYTAPIVYPLSNVPDGMRSILRWNPLTPLVQGFQWAVTGRTTMAVADIVIGVSTTALALFAGLVVFSVAQRTVADDL